MNLLRALTFICLPFGCITPMIALADLPQNDLHLEDGMFFNANMTKERFNQIIDSVANIYKPILAKQGKELVVEYNWDSSTVNASASQNGNKWKIAMFGGLARRPEITDDGLAMVVCHELGHHLGGFAFYAGGNWASSEGQSDYFANHVCSKKVFKGSSSRIAEFKARVNKTVVKKCDAVYDNDEQRSICYRSAAGGQSLANLLARLSGESQPSFETPDQNQVTKTYTAHPYAQCRLDTYLAASLCIKDFRDDFIPGRNNPRGQDSLAAQSEAFTFSCGSGVSDALRPRCWFKPL